jgi:hypothetical protein
VGVENDNSRVGGVLWPPVLLWDPLGILMITVQLKGERQYVSAKFRHCYIIAFSLDPFVECHL